MNMIEPWLNGWQFWSDRLPSVVARTWAKMRLEAVLEARRARFRQFQAGIVDVKMQGEGPRVGEV